MHKTLLTGQLPPAAPATPGCSALPVRRSTKQPPLPHSLAVASEELPKKPVHGYALTPHYTRVRLSPKAVILKQKLKGTLKHRKLATNHLHLRFWSQRWGPKLCISVTFPGTVAAGWGLRSENHCPQESKNGLKEFS